MSRFRIVQKPSFVKPSEPIFEVERRSYLLFWSHCGTYLTFEEALERIEELDTALPPIKEKVIYEKH